MNLLNLQEIMGQNGLAKWIIVSVVFKIVSAYIDIFLFTNLFRIKTTRAKKAQAVLINVIMKFMFEILIVAPYYRALGIIWSIVLFKIFFKQNTEKCVFGEVINTISIISIEAIFSKVFCVLFPDIDTYGQGMYDYRYKFCMMISICLGRLIICYIVKRKKLVMNIRDNLSKKNRNIIIIVSIIGCTIIFLNTVEMTMFISDFPYSIFVLDIVSLIIYFYISIKDIIRITELEEKDEKINTLESYNKTLSIMYDSIRGFRHDFSNFVQALDGYVQTNNMDGVKVMCESITKDCRNINNMGILDPSIINNAAVYSIITNKYYLALKENITMNIEVMVDLREIKICSYELCKILAILIDNAIESAKECDEKIVNIRFIKDVNNKKLVIIENTYSNLEVDIGKIFEKGYTTKKDEKGEHGLGLWTINKILNKTKNLELFTKKGELFCQQLEIYDN